MPGDSNKSCEGRNLTLRISYTECAEGAAPAEPAEEVQDSIDATV
jgi:hypothetical protein